jgi:glucosamine--fructose-6-phosphate aminotransferase (isomerizing)
MLKEIYEQPDVVRNSLAGRLVGVHQPIRFPASVSHQPDLPIAEALASINRLLIIGCGSSFHAGLVGKYFIEELVRLPVDVESAGEARYRSPIMDSQTVVVVISQSGETADTLEAMHQAHQKGAKVLAITNREDSSIARLADWVIPVRAGVEVSVCATKSFIAQVLALYLLGISMAESRKTVSDDTLISLKSNLFKVPSLIETVLQDTQNIEALAKKYCSARDILFIARGINFPAALEGALKLKEISYIHAEGYSGAELKHGPIAMLDSNVPVLSVLVQGPLFDKMLSNCQEAKARDAQVVAFTDDAQAAMRSKTFADIIEFPRGLSEFSPLIASIPMQLFAYYVAVFLGKDVDQPRNLAKSVTVE